MISSTPVFNSMNIPMSDKFTTIVLASQRSIFTYPTAYLMFFSWVYQKHLNLTCLTFSKQKLGPQTCLATSPCTYLVSEAKIIGSFSILHFLAFSAAYLQVLQSQPENCHESFTTTTPVSGQTTIISHLIHFNISQLVSPLPLLFPLNSVHFPHSRKVSYNVNQINIKHKSDHAIPPHKTFYFSWNDI